jgi:hypothetical protein
LILSYTQQWRIIQPLVVEEEVEEVLELANEAAAEDVVVVVVDVEAEVVAVDEVAKRATRSGYQ